MSAPVISVITVVYNGGQAIERTVRSVLEQTYENVQYIIVDGGSTDGTLAAIESYRDRIHQIVSERDHGIYDAMNKGIALASGDYVCFMNCGDVFSSDRVLMELKRYLQQGTGVVYSDVLVHDAGGNVRLQRCRRPEDFWKGTPFCHQAALFCMGSQKKFFDERYKLAADYKYALSYVKDGASFRQHEGVIAHYDGSGVSSENSLAAAREMYCIARESFDLSILQHAYYWAKLLRRFFKGVRC